MVFCNGLVGVSMRGWVCGVGENARLDEQRYYTGCQLALAWSIAGQRVERIYFQNVGLNIMAKADTAFGFSIIGQTSQKMFHALTVK